MEALPTDILCEIFDFLDPNWDDYPTAIYWVRHPKCYSHSDNRRDLSDIARLRLVCKRFNSLAAPYLFRCVVQRFNRRSFRRLECLAEHPELGKHVKKFVYLMPYLYEEGSKDFETFKLEGPQLCRDSMTKRIFDDDQFIYPRIYAEQQDIIRTSYDVQVLKKAMRSFRSLQRVTVLQTASHVDLALRRLAYSTSIALDQHPNAPVSAWDYVYCSWAPASQRVVETLLQALQYGESGVKSFVCPMISPQGLVRINRKIQQVALGGVWRQLTHLELSFDDKELSINLPHNVGGREQTNLDDHILLLSQVFFKDLFQTAENLSTIFLGFDHNRPLNIPIEAVFHEVSWPKLKSLGLESWRLSAKEIVDLVKRHRKTLRGLRLGNIQLRDGDLWRDVVVALRRHARELQLVSLDNCSYEKEFDKRRQQAQMMGNYHHGPFGTGAGLGLGGAGAGNANGEDGWMDELNMALGIEVEDSSASDTDESLEGSRNDDDEVEVVDYDDHGGLIGPGGIDSSLLLSGQTTANGAYTLGENHDLDFKLGGTRPGLVGLGLEDEEAILADNGQTITFAQRRRWEQWIVMGNDIGGRYVGYGNGNGNSNGKCKS